MPYPIGGLTAGDVRSMIERMSPAGRTLWITSLASFVVFLDTTVLFVAFPDITASFPEVAPTQLSWVLNAYTIVFAALLVPFGRLADRQGHKLMFLWGLVGFTSASLLCAVAPTAGLLVAARVLQAAAGAALVPSSLALLLRSTPHARIPVALAIWGATGAVAGAVGPTLGAALVETAGWRWVFVVNLPLGALAVWQGRRHLTESRQPETVLPSAVGVVLVIVASVLLTFGLVKGQEWGWLAAGTLASVIGGLVLLGVFVAHQARSTRPVIDLGLFRIRNFAWGNAASMTFGAAFTAMFLSSILFLTAVWGWSILEAGLGVAPGPAMVAVLAPFLGRLAARIGQRPLLILGGLLYAAGGWWRLFALGGEADYVGDYLPSMVLTGFGVALCLPQLSSLVGQALPPGQLGTGGAVNQALRQFAGTVGVALTVGFTAGITGLDDALAAFDRIWWIIVIGGLSVTLLALPLRRGAAVAPASPIDPAVAVAPAAGS